MRIYTRAEAEGLPVTTWVEQRLFAALQEPPAVRPRIRPRLVGFPGDVDHR